jgi:hypothetical protein
MAKRKRPTAPAPVNSHTASFSIAEITGDHTHTPITTFVERASEDNCRVYREEVVVEPPSPVKRYCTGQVHPAPSIHNNNGPTQPPSDASAERYQMGFFLDDEASMDPVPELEPTPRQAKPSVSFFNCFLVAVLVKYEPKILTRWSGSCSTPLSRTSGHLPREYAMARRAYLARSGDALFALPPSVGSAAGATGPLPMHELLWRSNALRGLYGRRSSYQPIAPD